MQLFARGFGGFISDKLYRKMGFRGRIWAQMICLFGIAIACCCFSSVKNDIPLAIVLIIVFSMFVQATEGTTYGMVPFLKPSQTGVAAGIVGAGGNAGAVVWSTMFKSIDHWPDVFFMMGIAIAFSGLICVILEVHGARITPGFSKDDNLDEWKVAITGVHGSAKILGGVVTGSPPSLTAHSGHTPTGQGPAVGKPVPDASLDGSSIVRP
jgi:NNP family nitrate/nitrite transporter-like MFS transporter